jgi:hypothetical protein
MANFGRLRATRPWGIPLPWTARIGMVLALAFTLSIVLFM